MLGVQAATPTFKFTAIILTTMIIILLCARSISNKFEFYLIRTVIFFRYVAAIAAVLATPLL